jgi:DNA-binding CsgD family transcriptional regulator
MNDFFTHSLFNLVSIVALFISVITLVISTSYIFKKRIAFQNTDVLPAKEFKSDVNQFNDKLRSKEKVISDLKTKLELKKSFEDELIKTIYEVESKENFNSKELLNELKLKLQNLSEIDKKQLVKNSTALDDKGMFQRELERLHPELSYQERTLCTYFRLHLSSKEISVIEGITNGTVRVYKNKIKHKIGLNQEESLNQYLCNLSNKKAA